jgi:hypothetical protein
MAHDAIVFAKLRQNRERLAKQGIKNSPAKIAGLS